MSSEKSPGCEDLQGQTLRVGPTHPPQEGTSLRPFQQGSPAQPSQHAPSFSRNVAKDISGDAHVSSLPTEGTSCNQLGLGISLGGDCREMR